MATFGPSSGNGGGPYTDQVTIDFAMDPDLEIIAINVWGGKYIDGIRLDYGSHGATIAGNMHGVTGGGATRIDLISERAHIVGIEGRTGKYVDSLTLTLSTGKTYHFGGGGGERDYKYQVDPVVIIGPTSFEDEIIGFFGNSGKYVDSIGVITKHLIGQPAPIP